MTSPSKDVRSEYWRQRREQVSSQLKLAMEKSGKTVSEIALELGVEYQKVWKWSKGQSAPQNAKMRLKVMEWCDRNIADSFVVEHPPGSIIAVPRPPRNPREEYLLAGTGALIILAMVSYLGIVVFGS